MTAADNPKLLFNAATNGFVELVRQIQPSQWGWSALGVWDIRALVGHATRALSTAETYLSTSSKNQTIFGPAEYFVTMLNDRGDPDERHHRDEAIAERGRIAGNDLGTSPIEEVSSLAARVLATIESIDIHAIFLLPVGTMTLADYLPTRTFELTVHSLDLAHALDIEYPALLEPAIVASCELAGQIAARRRNAAQLLRFFTGRVASLESLSIL